MHILVMGGTGAIGSPLVRMLAVENTVYVTSRQVYKSEDNIKYLQGNARDKDFFFETLSLHHWDAIVDFMVHPVREFEERLSILLDCTDQYVYVSSSRVYAGTSEKITEDSPRLLDVSNDANYLLTEEYALTKAREENLLKSSGKRNYTIIRPYITYNAYRLQLGTLEKENWLYRALHGRSIVFSKDVGSKLTTLTWGDDVAKGIASMIGKEQALGEVFHITCDYSISWNEVLAVYVRVLEEYLGNDRKVSVIMTEKSTSLLFPQKKYQLVYCRYFNRFFDNSKASCFCNTQEFTPPQVGLVLCLRRFLEAPRFSSIDWCLEAVNDSIAGEHTPLCEIPSMRDRINYLSYRYRLFGFFLYPVRRFFRILKKISKIE